MKSAVIETQIYQFKNNLDMKTKFDELKWYKEALQKQLKPCPFCGGSDIAIHVPNKEGKEDVTCLTCGAKMTKALGVGVVQSWNARS